MGTAYTKPKSHNFCKNIFYLNISKAQNYTVTNREKFGNNQLKIKDEKKLFQISSSKGYETEFTD